MVAILITGANGQLGSELRLREQKICRFFQERGLSSEDSIKIFYTDINELNVCDPVAVKDFFVQKGITHVINCAAYTAVDKAEDDIAAALTLNGYAPGYLAAAAIETGAILIHISTDYVFDGKTIIPYRECDTTSPSTVYGRTKLEGERAIAVSGCRYVIIRTSWLYSSFGTNFMKTILRLAGSKESINVVYDQIGTPTYAGDLSDAIIHIASDPGLNRPVCEHDESDYDENIFHYSNEGVCSWYDFATEIIKLANKHLAGSSGSHLNCKVLPVTSDQFPTAAKRPGFSLLNKDKIKKTFGLEIPHWGQSLEECIKLIDISELIGK